MAINGYLFFFADEPKLQNEYSAVYGSEETSWPLVTVIGASNGAATEGFEERTPWTPLSGRRGRFLGPVPLKTMNAALGWALEIADVVTLVWHPESKTITYEKGREYTPHRLRFWVFHTFFPMVLEFAGIYRILHAGTVGVAGGALLLSAPSFGGKSTLTDFFLRRGHPLFSDDSVALEKRENGYVALPSYPYHRPYRRPEVLGASATKIARAPASVLMFVLLEKVPKECDVHIGELRGIEKFKAFHYSAFIDFKFKKRERLDNFAEMAKNIPVYKVTVPWDIQRLHEVYEAITKQAASM
jgi:hypothetical protein